jgi:hypothetical protein
MRDALRVGRVPVQVALQEGVLEQHAPDDQD